MHAQGERLQYLYTYPRFNSTLRDSYYLCSVHGVSLNWLVDDRAIGVGFNDASQPGKVEVRTNEHGTAVNSSILLFRQSTNGGVYLISLLVVTTGPISMRPNVQCVCNGDSSQPNSGHEEMRTAIKYRENHGIIIDYVFTMSSLVLGYTFRTHLLLCRSSGPQQLWEVNNRSLGLFSTGHDYRSPLTNRRSTEGLVSGIAVLLSRQPIGLVSMLVLANTSSFFATCQGITGLATLSEDVSYLTVSTATSTAASTVLVEGKVKFFQD